MALSIEAMSRIIAQLVKEQIDGLVGKDDLIAENKALTELVEGLEKRLSGLGSDLMSRATQADKRMAHLEDCIGQDMTERNIVSRLMSLENTDLPKQVRDACETLWDESWQHKMVSMMPDDWQEPLARLENQVRNIELTPGPAGVVDESMVDAAVVKAIRNFDFHTEIAKMIPDPVVGPEGPRGASGEAGNDGADGPEGPQGERGIDGDDGCPGERGADGIDRPILDIVEAEAGDKVEKGTMVAHNGGLWMSKRKSKGDPSEDPASFLLAVSGTYDYEVDQVDERTIRITHVRSDDAHVVSYINTHAVMHRGMWKVGGEYDLNDETMSDGSTWRCVVDKTSARPGDNGDWKLTTQAKTGKKGLSGKVGPAGAPGRGIKQLVWVDATHIAVEYDDGTQDVIEIRKGDET